jgi:hypothetical protein
VGELQCGAYGGSTNAVPWPLFLVEKAIIKVTDKVASLTGWNENACASTDRRCSAVHTHPRSHAGYYPRRFSTWLLKA